MIVVLTGGTGGAKFVQGLKQVVAPRDLVAVVNTGDDFVCWGLNISPDLDSITYALAGILSRERGWGIEGDTFECLEAMRRLGEPAWFRLGDRDLATHVFRTAELRAGKPLSEVTREIAARLGVESRVLPMSDQPVETRVMTPLGELGFEEYFVRERHGVPVSEVRFRGSDRAVAAPGVLDAIANAEAILVAPSNPITSIGPILAVAGIREALRETPAPVAAISPIVGGAAVSGPAADLMRMQNLEVSASGVARAYSDFLDLLIADQSDSSQAADLETAGVGTVFTPTVMKSEGDKKALAEAALRGVTSLRTAGAAR